MPDRPKARLRAAIFGVVAATLLLSTAPARTTQAVASPVPRPVVEPVPHQTAARAQLAPYPDDSIIRGARSPRLYVVYGGLAHAVATPTVLTLLGLDTAPVSVLPQATLNVLAKGGTLLEHPIVDGLPNPYSPIIASQARLYTYPPSASAGITLSIRGGGFAPGEAVKIDLPAGLVITQTVADALGLVRADIVVPSSLALGVHRLTATGLRSGFFVVEPFTVVPAAVHATVIATPNYALRGGAVSVSGTGFQPGEAVYVYAAQESAATTAANGAGGFGPVTLSVPAATAIGFHSLWAYGVTSRYIAAGVFAVAPPLPANVQALPTTTSPGSTVTLSGSGFVPGEHIDVTVDNQPAGHVAANADGTLAGAVVVIPPHIRAGTVALTARGQTSDRATSAVITIIALTPSLLVAPATVVPSGTIRVAGTGFAHDEVIALALDGQALTTTPATVTADAQGNFFASALIPPTALAGTATIAASGLRSGAVATAGIAVRLPVAIQWYFAGIDSRPGSHSLIAILNPDNGPAQVGVHAICGDSAHNNVVRVGGHSRAVIDPVRLTGQRVLCAVRLSSDRRISAAATTFRGERDWSTTPGVRSPERTWYLAEGYTSGSFYETLHLYNPNGSASDVTLQLLPGHGATRTVRLRIGADSGKEIVVNHELPRQAVSIVVRSSRSIVVQRAIVFGKQAAGATASAGSAAASATWYTILDPSAHGSHTMLAVLNTDRHNPAAVTATFYAARGANAGTRTIIVAPLHRGTIDIDGSLTRHAASAVLTSNVSVVVEKIRYFGRGNSAASAITGIEHPAPSWQFPEGDTGNTSNTSDKSAHGGKGVYHEFLLLANPSSQPAAVGAEFYATDGTAAHLDVTIPAHGRTVVDVNSVPGLPAGLHGAVLSAENGVPFMAEQYSYDAALARGDGMVGLPL